MATYQQLQDDILWYLDRRDAAGRVASWVLMVETEFQQTLRARCMETSAEQAIDAAYITLPPDFSTMASIQDATTGVNLVLKDDWSGSWTDRSLNGGPVTAYRIHADCIEFLPHPVFPEPIPENWIPQKVLMTWYARPKPLILPSDTNPVLEQLYSCYLYGVLSHATMAEQDEPMAPQWDAKYQQAITRANLNKQQSDYSGAPYVAEMSGAFD